MHALVIRAAADLFHFGEVVQMGKCLARGHSLERAANLSLEEHGKAVDHAFGSSEKIQERLQIALVRVDEFRQPRHETAERNLVRRQNEQVGWQRLSKPAAGVQPVE